MISPRANTPTAAILALICATPGEETIETLAAHAFPPPRRLTAFRSYAEIRAYADARNEHTRKTREQTSRIVRRLAEAGYLEARTGPVLAAWFIERMNRDGLAEALRASGSAHHPSRSSISSTGPLVFGGHHVKFGATYETMIRVVAKGPATVADVIGRAPSGRAKALWANLVEWGIVLTPSARFPTEKARALVASWVS